MMDNSQISDTITSTVAKLAPDVLNKAANELMSSDGWKYRRLALYGVLSFLCLSVGFIQVRGVDNPLNEQAMLYELMAIVTLTSAYVLTAAWDDKEKRIHLFRPDDNQQPR